MKRLFSVALGLGLAAVFLMCIADPAYAAEYEQFAIDQSLADYDAQQVANGATIFTPAPAIDTGPDFLFGAMSDSYILSAIYNDIIDQPSTDETEVTDAAIFNYAAEESSTAAMIDTPAREPDHPMLAARTATEERRQKA